MTADLEPDWLPIRGFEGLYEISSDYHVRSISRHLTHTRRSDTNATTRHYEGRELAPWKTRTGRLQVVLHDANHKRHGRFIEDPGSSGVWWQ